MQFNIPGFLPPVDQRYVMGMNESLKAAMEWKERIERGHADFNLPLDRFQDLQLVAHHNEIVINCWVFTVLLKENTAQEYFTYEWPPKSGNKACGKVHKCIGNERVFGTLKVLYHEDNFPDMLYPVESSLTRDISNNSLHANRSVSQYRMAFSPQLPNSRTGTCSR